MRGRRGFLTLQFAVVIALIAAAQGVIYYAILDRTVGSPKWLGGVGATLQPFRVAVLRSEAGAKMTPDHPEYYFDLAKQWEAVLMQSHTSYRLISDADLTPALAKSTDVLVLPWAVCLGETQTSAIQSFVESGKGLVLSGATGTRGADCTWKGWDSLGKLTGLKSLSGQSGSPALMGAYTGSNFYSGAVPAGYQFPLASQEVVTGAAAETDVYAADARLRPIDNGRGSAIATHGVRGRGRFVWFGFAETVPVKDDAARGTLDGYMLSAVEWAGRQPIAAVANWPHAAHSAVVVAAHITDADSAVSTISTLRDSGVRATFFVDSQTASKSPQLVRSLAGLGEVASSGDAPESFAEQRTAGQTARLTDARRRMQAEAGVTLAGFAPPDNLWDDGTVSALRSSGFSYYLNRASAARTVPQLIAAPIVSFLPVRQAPLARLDAPFADDFELMTESPNVSPAGRIWSDFEIAEKTFGAYTLSFRTDLLGSPENAPALSGLLNKMKARQAWMTTGSNLADWWIRRERVRTDVHQVNEHRIRLAVSNGGRFPVADASVYVYLPNATSRLRVIAALLGSDVPHYEVNREGVLRLDFPKLPARTSYVCLISMDEK